MDGKPGSPVGLVYGFVLVAACTIVAAIGAAPARAFPGEQVARGELVWNAVCADCHGPGSQFDDAPLLLPPGSLKAYPNAGEAVKYARDSMPTDMPASLPEQDYWDVVAFILKQHGIEHDVELGPDSGAAVRTIP